MGKRDLLFFAVVLGGGLLLISGMAKPPSVLGEADSKRNARAAQRETPAPDFPRIVDRADAEFARLWDESGVSPASAASEFALMRRLSLALTGSIPSLEEVRRYEARPSVGRLDAWLDDLLRDRRTADYLSERFARAFVGTEDGPFLLFRRRRFTAWLSDALFENRPYDALVRELIAGDGVWTDHPATNFVSVTFDQETGRPDPERIAARVSRAFLGVRFDCARCHDHPFQSWKQNDFRGLAAFFGGIRADLRGIRDGEVHYQPPDRKTKEPQKVDACVPFLNELQPGAGPLREQLAGWIVDPKNPHLSRATVNRVWGILFGRPLVEPIDDLPAEEELPPVLKLLADDFAAHRYDLRRLIRTIASTRAFRLDSAVSTSEAGPSAEQEELWASFPLTRLRPEQVSGAVYQASSLGTLGPDSPWFVRFAVYTARNEFIKRYGDAGENELEEHPGTIPQRLLLMNGKLVEEKTRDELFNASSRIADLAPDDRKAVEAAYLSILTRYPSPEELAHFLKRIEGTKDKERKDRLTDLCWTLLNATEFSWNH